MVEFVCASPMISHFLRLNAPFELYLLFLFDFLHCHKIKNFLVKTLPMILDVEIYYSLALDYERTTFNVLCVCLLFLLLENCFQLNYICNNIMQTKAMDMIDE